MTILAGGIPVYIRAGAAQQFKITPEQLAAAITDKTRLLVLNSPSNPTGMAYTRAELEALGDVLRQYPNILVATDDMYEHILWSDEPFCNILMACPDLYDQTMVLNGVSKAYSMTGWRIGYAGGPADIIKSMKKIQSQSASISQAAAVAALNGPQNAIGTMLKAFRERHDYVVERLNGMKGIECLPTDGTFYVFPNIEGMIEATDAVSNDLEMGEYLIENAGVAVVPGSAFGLGGHMRISIATGMDALEKALDRIEKVVNG
jgi:aspartate aminotransferase